MLSKRMANGSCRTEIARPKGTVVSIFGMQKNCFFAWRKTDTAVRTAYWLRKDSVPLSFHKRLRNMKPLPLNSEEYRQTM